MRKNQIANHYSFEYKAKSRHASVKLQVKYYGIISTDADKDDDDERYIMDVIEAIIFNGQDIKDALFAMNVEDDIKERALQDLRDNDIYDTVRPEKESFGQIHTGYANVFETLGRVFTP